MSNRTCGLFLTAGIITLLGATVLTYANHSRYWWTLLTPIGIMFAGAVADHYAVAAAYKRARRGQYDHGIRHHARNAQIRHNALQRQRADFPQWETEVRYGSDMRTPWPDVRGEDGEKWTG